MNEIISKSTLQVKNNFSKSISDWLHLTVHAMCVNNCSWLYTLWVLMIAVRSTCYVCEWLQLGLHTASVNDCSSFYMLCVWMTAVGSTRCECEWFQLVLHTMCVDDCSWFYTLCVWMIAVGSTHYVCEWLQLALNVMWMIAVGSKRYVCEWLQLALQVTCVNDCSWLYTLYMWMTAVGSKRYAWLNYYTKKLKTVVIIVRYVKNSNSPIPNRILNPVEHVRWSFSAKIVTGFVPLTISQISSIVDFQLGSTYASE